MKRTLVSCSVVFIVAALSGCDVILEDNLPVVADFKYSINSINKSENTASVQIQSEISDEESITIYDNNEQIFLDSGSAKSGTVTLKSGVHNMKICASNYEGERCSSEVLAVISRNLEVSAYQKYDLEAPSLSLSNDGFNVLYVTKLGKEYRLDLQSNQSTFMGEIPENDDVLSVSGLAYIDDISYYFSKAGRNGQAGALYKFENGEINLLTAIQFPDGLDFVDDKIYSVTNDRSGVLTVFDANGRQLSTLFTEIDDPVGISHSEKFLYVLAEDGSIYQVDKVTGDSVKIFTNDNLFKNVENGVYGVEAITVLDNRIYVSYVNDSSLYLIDVNLEDYEVAF